jgi:hypothetical protein
MMTALENTVCQYQTPSVLRERSEIEETFKYARHTTRRNLSYWKEHPTREPNFLMSEIARLFACIWNVAS